MKILLSHKIFSVALAALVLFSTLSLTVEKHFCGDNLIDVAIFSEATTCGMEMLETEAIKKSCCKDEVEVIKGQDDLKLNTLDDLSFESFIFIQSFAYSFEGLFISLPKQIIPHKNYAPPNLIKDIHVLDETFLI